MSDYMKKLYRYFKFQLKMTGKNLARHFGLAMSAAFSVTITLVLISSFLLLTSNLSNFGENIQGQVTIRCLLYTSCVKKCSMN